MQMSKSKIDVNCRCRTLMLTADLKKREKNKLWKRAVKIRHQIHLSKFDR